jgi:hypothetical protein
MDKRQIAWRVEELRREILQIREANRTYNRKIICLPGAGSHLAQVFDQSILRGAEESFYPPFGLRRVGRDPFDV